MSSMHVYRCFSIFTEKVFKKCLSVSALLFFIQLLIITSIITSLLSLSVLNLTLVYIITVITFMNFYFLLANVLSLLWLVMVRKERNGRDSLGGI